MSWQFETALLVAGSLALTGMLSYWLFGRRRGPDALKWSDNVPVPAARIEPSERALTPSWIGLGAIWASVLLFAWYVLA
jgi:hypothetical protein